MPGTCPKIYITALPVSICGPQHLIMPYTTCFTHTTNTQDARKNCGLSMNTLRCTKKKMFTVGTRQVKSKQGQKKERGRMEKTGGTNNSGSVRKTTLSSTRWFCTFVHNVNISRSTEQRTTRCVTKKLTLTPPLQPSWLPRQRGGVATSGAVVIPSQSERAAAHSKQKCPCTVLTTVGPLRQHQEQAWSKLTSYERAFQHC